MVGQVDVEGSLSGILRDGHARRALVRWGLWPIVQEAMGEMLVTASLGYDVALVQRSTGPRSWCMTIEERDYHLRERPMPGAARDGAIHLRSSYQDGRLVASWRNPHDVRRWFDKLRERLLEASLTT